MSAEELKFVKTQLKWADSEKLDPAHRATTLLFLSPNVVVVGWWKAQPSAVLIDAVCAASTDCLRD